MDGDNNKHYGTVFMGNRESNLAKIDAMQSAALKEQHQRKVQEDYLERVKNKAVARAKEILGAAYAERERILNEAEKEAQNKIEKLTAAYAERERILNEAEKEAQNKIEKLTAESNEYRASAVAENECAQRERLEAEKIRQKAQKEREQAHTEGYNAGMEIAQEEIADFRIQMGMALSSVMQALHRECSTIFENWKTDLTEVCRAAIEKNTSIILTQNRREVLQRTLVQAVQQLESQKKMTVFVNADDEGVVSDMFSAAHETMPDLNEWVIKSDASLEPGSLIVENEQGSVELRREICRSIVNNILEHLCIFNIQDDAESSKKIACVVEKEIAEIMDKASSAKPDDNKNVAGFTDEKPALLTNDNSDDVEQVLSPNNSVDSEDISKPIFSSDASVSQDIMSQTQESIPFPNTSVYEHANSDVLTDDIDSGIAASPDIKTNKDQDNLNQGQTFSEGELSQGNFHVAEDSLQREEILKKNETQNFNSVKSTRETLVQLEDEIFQDVPNERDVILAEGGFLQPDTGLNH